MLQNIYIYLQIILKVRTFVSVIVEDAPRRWTRRNGYYQDYV